MKPVKYDKLYDELLEQYPIEDNPELYSLYTSMLNHLMKVFKLKHSTAVKLLLKVEERLGLHLMRDREMTNMKLINVTKGNDIKKYYRMMYWIQKINIENVIEIYDKYNDINASIVKKFLFEKGQISENKYSEFTYAKNYYRQHKQELLEKKRIYRQQKRLQKEKIK